MVGGFVTAVSHLRRWAELGVSGTGLHALLPAGQGGHLLLRHASGSSTGPLSKVACVLRIRIGLRIRIQILALPSHSKLNFYILLSVFQMKIPMLALFSEPKHCPLIYYCSWLLAIGGKFEAFSVHLSYLFLLTWNLHFLYHLEEGRESKIWLESLVKI